MGLGRSGWWWGWDGGWGRGWDLGFCGSLPCPEPFQSGQEIGFRVHGSLRASLWDLIRLREIGHGLVRCLRSVGWGVAAGSGASARPWRAWGGLPDCSWHLFKISGWGIRR